MYVILNILLLVLASFRNVWWSMANEWDYVKAKTVDDWKLLTKTVVENDPYRPFYVLFMERTATYFDYLDALNLPMSAYRMRHRY